MEAWKKHEVIPDVIKTPPAKECSVTYGSAKLKMGDTLTPKGVKDVPKITWDANPEDFHTLMMVDPDAPSRKNPKFREWHHWLVGNIPGCDFSHGEVLSQYISSAPPKDSGLHRYVFLVYKQKSKIKFDEPRLKNTSGKNRGNFSAEKFVSKYDLGDPVAGNFFLAEWDTYVPTVYKQLKD